MNIRLCVALLALISLPSIAMNRSEGGLIRSKTSFDLRSLNTAEAINKQQVIKLLKSMEKYIFDKEFFKHTIHIIETKETYGYWMLRFAAHYLEIVECDFLFWNRSQELAEIAAEEFSVIHRDIQDRMAWSRPTIIDSPRGRSGDSLIFPIDDIESAKRASSHKKMQDKENSVQTLESPRNDAPIEL